MPHPIEGTIIVKIANIIIGENRRKDLGDLLSLANSLSMQGLINPIVVDRANNLIAGLRRLEAAKLLKWICIEARLYEELSPAERRKVEIEEDIAQKKARSWQEEVALKKELHDLLVAERDAPRKGRHGEKGWTQADTATRLDIPTTTFSEELRLAEAIKMFPEVANATTKKDAIRKMYMMREIALLRSISKKMEGMGIEIEDDVCIKNKDAYIALKELPDESFDLCITDPPWGIEVEKAGSARSIDYEKFKDSKDVWMRFLKDGLPEIFRILKEGSHFWLFFGPENYQKTRDRMEEVGFDVRYVPCIWIKEKPNYTDTEFKPMPGYEMFFYSVRRKDKEKAPRRLNEATSDCFNYPRNTVGRIHRTEKPVELLKRLIGLSSSEDDRVLDPFAGSGSTLAAALLLQRKALGFELDPKMHEMASGRLQALIVEETEIELVEPAGGI
jgi:site-specific DNA-methyltransferase (adenine-specific)